MLRCALAAVPMACAVLLSSCYGDEYGDCPATGGDAVPVKVNVSAGVIGDLNGSRAGGDVNAEEHEFINTLYVYIVNDDNGTPRVYDDISPDLSADVLAQGGNLTSWTSGTFTLDPGTYTFYAFANIDNYVGEYGSTGSTTQKTGKQLLDDCFGATSTDSNFELRDGDLNQFRLLDPAGEIDLDGGKYIPMSAVGTITVNGDLNASGGIVVDLPLERLVGKIRLTVSDGADVTDDSEVTFSGYSENVPLMEGSTSSDHGDRTGEFTAKLSDAEDTADGRLFSFYVNETPEGLPFTVTLATGNTTGVTTYTASPRRRILPRNSIYPLKLTFPDFSPEIEWLSWVAPIGNYPVEVNVKEENYTVYIAEGAQFEFTVAGMASSTNTAKLESVQWTVPDDLADKITDVSNSGATLSATLSAGVGVGTDLPLSLTVSWWFATVEETNPNLLTRTYNVTIHTIDITGVEFKTGTRAGGSYGMRLLGGEVLNMFKVN